MCSKIDYNEIIKNQPTINIGCLGSVTDGKCFAPGTLISMFNQPSKAIEKINIGDIVLGDDYTPRNVIAVTSGEDQMYEIVQESGENFTCNSKHILCLIKESTNKEILISAEDFFNLEPLEKADLSAYRNKSENDILVSIMYSIKIVKKEFGDYYGFTIDGNNRFLLNDLTVTHNSSMVGTICHVKTQKHSSEHIKNITIKLGYANAKIFKCPNCPDPDCYESYGSNVEIVECKNCNENMTLIRHISFVDCPGHNDLLLTMLSGTAVMDHSIVVVSGAEELESKRQLKEHIFASISELENYLICLNKLDLIDKDTAMNRYKKLIEYVEDTPLNNSPVIPTAFNKGINKKWLLKYIVEKLQDPERKLDVSPLFRVTRSFDINKPGCAISDLEGGVIGGSLIKGIMNVGDIIEMRPGIIKKTQAGLVYKPIITKISSIKSEDNKLEKVIPGGLIALGTDMDSYYTKNDMAVGNTCGHPGSLPDVYQSITISFTNLEDYFGDITDPPKLNEILLINCNSISIACKVKRYDDNELDLELIGRLICLDGDDTIILSRNINEGCKIIGKGKLINGIKANRI